MSRVAPSHFFLARATPNSFWELNQLLNRFFLQLSFYLIFLETPDKLWGIYGDEVDKLLRWAIYGKTIDKIWAICWFSSAKWPLSRILTSTWWSKKRIGSPKKELTIHNSLSKRLIESVLQLSTPESLPLYRKFELWIITALMFTLTITWGR